jgi:endoglucanase
VGWSRLSLAGVVALLALGPGAAVSSAGTANAGIPGASKTNPLDGVHWGAYDPDTKNVGVDKPAAYAHLAKNARDRADFMKIVDLPRFRWFGKWMPVHTHGYTKGARDQAREYIQETTHGHGDWGSQMAIFRMDPWENKICGRVPSKKQIRDYKAWILQFAKGIGDQHRVAIELQPDLPFARCLKHHSPIAYKLISFAARKFDALDHTTVYIDGGSVDYVGAPGAAAKMLLRAGVKHVQGFALNATHYAPTGAVIKHGKAVAKALAHRGAKGKHFIVNTAGNGRPFISFKHRAEIHSHAICRSKHQKICITLGKPPTTDTHSKVVDGELWIGQPWSDGNPHDYGGILRLVRTSPFF